MLCQGSFNDPYWGDQTWYKSMVIFEGPISLIKHVHCLGRCHISRLLILLRGPSWSFFVTFHGRVSLKRLIRDWSNSVGSVLLMEEILHHLDGNTEINYCTFQLVQVYERKHKESCSFCTANGKSLELCQPIPGQIGTKKLNAKSAVQPPKWAQKTQLYISKGQK